MAEWRESEDVTMESYFGPFTSIVQQLGITGFTPAGLFPAGLFPFVPGMYQNRGRGEVIPAYLNDQGLQYLRDVSRESCLKNEFAAGFLENRISFIAGTGFKYRVKASQPDGRQWIVPCQTAIDDFVRQTLWNEAEQETVKRCDRDGETFIRFFPCPNGDLEYRFIEPEHVRTPSEYAGQREFNLGVQTPPRDVAGDPINFWVITDLDRWTTEPINASDILHIKCNVDSSSKRGLPFLFSVGENLERAEKTLRNFAIMAQVVATFAVLRKHNAPPSAVARFRDQLATTTVSDPVTGSDRAIEQMFPGGIVDVSKQSEYEFPASQVNVGGYVQTLQAELRAIGVRAVMPEYMISGDASNANYASTMISESPGNRMFERSQAFFGARFATGTRSRMSVMNRVLLAKSRAGMLPRNILDIIEVSAQGPNLAVRDRDKETARNKILFDAGIIDRKTWAQREDIDPNDIPADAPTDATTSSDPAKPELV